MAKERLHIPASTAGITRYFEEYRSKVEIKPGHVIGFAIFIGILVLALHAFGGAFLNP